MSLPRNVEFFENLKEIFPQPGARVRLVKSPIDPFLMFDDFEWKAPPREGLFDHAHRGMEIITYILEGAFAHEDFLGHLDILESGDSLILTVGRGIMHAEITSETLSPRIVRGMNIRINLPKCDKMIEPVHQKVIASEIPVAKPDKGIEIKVVTGESYGVKSKAMTRNPTLMLDIRMEKGKKIKQDIVKDYQGYVYILEGSAYIGGSEENNENQKKGEMFDIFKLDDSNGKYLCIETKECDVRLLLITGKPVREPLGFEGPEPFAMNTKEEIQQARDDFKECRNGFERAKNWHSSIASSLGKD